MGGDGQALTNNRTLLQKSKLYEKQTDPEATENQEKQTEKERRIELWTHCAISLDPLEYPVAFDLAGHVFSKQSVVNFLMEKKSNPDATDNTGAEFDIRKLADVRDVENEMDVDCPVVCCTVSGVSAAAGLHKFVGYWGCGHVVAAASANSADDNDEAECPVCGSESCVVQLALDSQKAAEEQRKRLRTALRLKRKRTRKDDKDAA